MMGALFGDGGEDVSIVSVVYPRGAVSASYLGYFLSVGSSSKPYHPSTFKSISRVRGGGNKNSLICSRIRPGMRSGFIEAR